MPGGGGGIKRGSSGAGKTSESAGVSPHPGPLPREGGGSGIGTSRGNRGGRRSFSGVAALTVWGLDEGLDEEETPPPTVKVGDYVQWISKGAEQF